MLIDTDVLIWMTRGHEGAAKRLGQMLPWRLSVVTYIELAQGCRTKLELVRLKKGLDFCAAQVLPLTPAISERTVALIDDYALSHGLRLGRCLDRRYRHRARAHIAHRQHQALCLPA